MIQSTQTPEPPDDLPSRKPAGELFKFKHVNEITGTFVIVILLLLVAAVVWTGRSQRWFKSNVTLRIILPEAGAAGIRQGSEVYFLGTLVGSVSDVLVDTSGHMEAEANIRHDFFRFVRADSSAVVKKKFGVAGDAFFEITRGVGKSLPEKNASIICNEQLQSVLESAIDDIRRETLLILKKTSTGLETWTQLGIALNETREQIAEFTERLDEIASGIQQGKGNAGKLIADTALMDEAEAVMKRANETVLQLQRMMTNLNAAAASVQKGTERLPEIANSVATSANDFPALIQQTQTSMRELERLIEGAQRHWLLRKYMNKTNPPPSAPRQSK